MLKAALIAVLGLCYLCFTKHFSAKDSSVRVRCVPAIDPREQAQIHAFLEVCCLISRCWN